MGTKNLSLFGFCLLDMWLEREGVWHLSRALSLHVSFFLFPVHVFVEIEE